MKIVSEFEIPYYQILDEESKPTQALPEFAKDQKHLLKLYRLMMLNRIFDTKAIALQRTGKLGTYPSTRGQEAAFVGMGDALLSEDIFVPYYRDVSVLIQRGVKLSEILLYWGGDERGNAFECDSKDFPYSVPVGSQPLHGAGIATALNIQKKKAAVLTVTGDGGTSEGDFYEALNIAGVWHLPVVFVICNNQWAISVPLKQQTSCKTLAQKAIAGGFQGEQIDGNDVIAVRDRTAAALKKAREQREPTLLEIVCYRHCDHTTADDATRYETPGCREQEWVKEPIERLKRYLQNNQILTPDIEAEIQKDCEAKVDEAVNEYINKEPERPEVMFDYLYETLPDIYLDQRETVKKWSHNDHG